MRKPPAAGMLIHGPRTLDQQRFTPRRRRLAHGASGQGPAVHGLGARDHWPGPAMRDLTLCHHRFAVW
jgi:hypothetical protein